MEDKIKKIEEACDKIEKELIKVVSLNSNTAELTAKNAKTIEQLTNLINETKIEKIKDSNSLKGLAQRVDLQFKSVHKRIEKIEDFNSWVLKIVLTPLLGSLVIAVGYIILILKTGGKGG